MMRGAGLTLLEMVCVITDDCRGSSGACVDVISKGNLWKSRKPGKQKAKHASVTVFGMRRESTPVPKALNKQSGEGIRSVWPSSRPT